MIPKPQHAKAHVVTKITAEHKVGPWHEPHGALQSVANFPEKMPGVIQHARLGAAGLQLQRDEHVICIPIELLFDMAATINPKFNARPDKKLSTEEVEKLAANK